MLKKFTFLWPLIFISCLPTPDPNPLDKDKDHSETPIHTSVTSSNPDTEKQKVLGPDQNTDGIRDDIEAWIGSQAYNDQRVEKALNKLARSYQQELKNAFHVSHSRKATRSAIQATDCLYSLIGPELGHQVRDELKSKTFNNPLRQKWARRVQRNFQNESIPPVKDYSPEANCPFL